MRDTFLHSTPIFVNTEEVRKVLDHILRLDLSGVNPKGQELEDFVEAELKAIEATEKAGKLALRLQTELMLHDVTEMTGLIITWGNMAPNHKSILAGLYVRCKAARVHGSIGHRGLELLCRLLDTKSYSVVERWIADIVPDRRYSVMEDSGEDGSGPYLFTLPLIHVPAA